MRDEARNQAINDLIARHLEEYETLRDKYEWEIRFHGGILQ
jgi:hypothetical protein